MDAAQSLRDHRATWGIESGLHQRLDVSHMDDQGRGREARSMRLTGMFRRLSKSIFMRWRSRQSKPLYKTTADFFTAVNAEPRRYAIRCLHAREPSF